MVETAAKLNLLSREKPSKSVRRLIMIVARKPLIPKPGSQRITIGHRGVDREQGDRAPIAMVVTHQVQSEKEVACPLKIVLNNQKPT